VDGGLRIAVIDGNEVVRSALVRRLGEDARVASVMPIAPCDFTPRCLDAFDAHVVLIDPRSEAASGGLLAAVAGDPGKERGYAVIVHVAYYRVGDDEAAQALGVDLYCLKGLKAPELVDRMIEAVRHRLPPERWPESVAHRAAAQGRRGG
jgi:hypothetical protein